MSQKLISEREAVLRERAAWVACDLEYCRLEAVAATRAQSERTAAARYPLPKVERPRVVSDDSVKWSGTLYWRAVGGVLEWRRTEGWQRIDSETSGMFINPARVRLLADLLANPTELVDDDGSVSSSRPEGRASSEETT